MINLLYYWLVIGLIFLILEVFNAGLFLFLSISCGSVAGAVSSLFDFSFQQQIYIFFGTLFGVFVVLSYWLKRNERKSVPKSLKTNTAALIGTHGVVIKEITPVQKGYIKVNGELWLAQSSHDCPIGTIIEVTTVTGCHCIVKQVYTSK